MFFGRVSVHRSTNMIVLATQEEVFDLLRRPTNS